MANISITTTQNVTIDYTLANFGIRLGAYFIDIFIIIVWYMIHAGISHIFFGEYSAQIYQFIFIVPFISFYTLIMENLMSGQTPGKRFVGIRVMKLNGREPVFMDYFTRWILRFVEITMSGGVIAGMMISTTALKQRIGDVIAGTVLVRVQVLDSLKVIDLLKITSRKEYQANYPAVVQFKESEMLLIKRLVDRNQNYGNKAHRILIDETAEKFAKKMQTNIHENNTELFLKTLIRDYVVLTR